MHSVNVSASQPLLTKTIRKKQVSKHQAIGRKKISIISLKLTRKYITINYVKEIIIKERHQIVDRTNKISIPMFRGEEEEERTIA